MFNVIAEIEAASSRVAFELYKHLQHDVENNEVRLLLFQASKEMLAAVTTMMVLLLAGIGESVIGLPSSK